MMEDSLFRLFRRPKAAKGRDLRRIVVFITVCITISLSVIIHAIIVQSRHSILEILFSVAALMLTGILTILFLLNQGIAKRSESRRM